MIWKIAKTTLGILFVISILGCIDEDAFSFLDYDSDRCGTSSSDLSGIWTLSGEGKRSECREDFLDTDRFVIRSLELPIAHDTSTGRLTLGDANFAEDFRLEDGRVNGACVSFTTVEMTGSAEIRYEWEGTVESGELRGNFEGYGPKTCVSEGEFSAQY